MRWPWNLFRQEFCSLNGSDGEDLDRLPSDGVLSLDYLTLELKVRFLHAKNYGKTIGKPCFFGCKYMSIVKPCLFWEYMLIAVLFWDDWLVKGGCVVWVLCNFGGMISERGKKVQFFGASYRRLAMGMRSDEVSRSYSRPHEIHLYQVDTAHLATKLTGD